MSFVLFFWKDLNTFENLRTTVTDASIFCLTRCLFFVFLSALFFHLYCFLPLETRKIVSYLSTSPNGLWATACKLTQGKNAQRAYGTSKTVTDDFPGCCCLFPFVSFLIWSVTYSFPLILFDLWRKKKVGMLKKEWNRLQWFHSLICWDILISNGFKEDQTRVSYSPKQKKCSLGFDRLFTFISTNYIQGYCILYA